MKLNIFKTLAWGVLLMGFAACEKDYEKADYDAPLAEAGILPTLTTGEVGAFGESAIIDASIEGAEGTAITNWGVLVSTTPEPTLAGSIKVEGDITKTSQKFAVSGLTEGTHYYYRAFVTDGVSIAFGDTKEFTTDGAAWGVQEGYWMFATAEEADQHFPYRAILDATHESACGFTTTTLENLFANIYGITSSIWDPEVMYYQGSASQTTMAVTNAAGFKFDFTGMYFPKVWFDAIQIQAYFGETGYPGHFDVYVSNELIEDMATLENAVKIGSSKGPGKAQELYATNLMTSEPMKFDIPMEFWGETYIYVVNTSDYDGKFSGAKDFGVTIFGYGLEVTAPKAE